jgi:hypothetical protein
MPITIGKDLMYGGTLKTPPNAPNAAFISSPSLSTFSMTVQSGLSPGGNVQLFIRQWINGTGQTVLFQAWDGASIWEWNLNGDGQWGLKGTSSSWPSPAFQVGAGAANQWSMIAQTGGAGNPDGSTDQNFAGPIVIGPTVGNKTTVTFQNVPDGKGGSTNIVVTIEIDGLSR